MVSFILQIIMLSRSRKKPASGEDTLKVRKSERREDGNLKEKFQMDERFLLSTTFKLIYKWCNIETNCLLFL